MLRKGWEEIIGVPREVEVGAACTVHRAGKVHAPQHKHTNMTYPLVSNFILEKWCLICLRLRCPGRLHLSVRNHKRAEGGSLETGAGIAVTAG